MLAGCIVYESKEVAGLNAAGRVQEGSAQEKTEAQTGGTIKGVEVMKSWSLLSSFLVKVNGKRGS
jgi:hypothetical protein